MENYTNSINQSENTNRQLALVPVRNQMGRYKSVLKIRRDNVSLIMNDRSTSKLVNTNQIDN